MTPKRIQLRRTKGWRKPEGVIVVSRPSRWGNWYKVVHVAAPAPDRGWWVGMDSDPTIAGPYDHKVKAIGKAVDWFREDCAEVLRAETDGRFHDDLAALRGHGLACWCPPDQPCHADVLLELANAPEATNTP